jgi:AraC-like DNA-binding protein
MVTHAPDAPPKKRTKGRGSGTRSGPAGECIHPPRKPPTPSGTRPGRSFSDEIRLSLWARLFTEDCSAGAMASLFSMHPRTLRRRLRREGTTFQNLLNERRFEFACELLARTEMTFSEIAAALGYSEPSGFTRAFRHWSGRTPTAWRAEHTT